VLRDIGRSRQAMIPGRRYRVPHVRLLVRMRALHAAGRCSAACSSYGDVMAWLCDRAPPWTVALVCKLLREDGWDTWCTW
jgi:hypothetical protein